jgi:hypothetical protein
MRNIGRRIRAAPSRIGWSGSASRAQQSAAFQGLATAIQHIGRLRLDQQHIVTHRDEVIWPDNVRRRLTGAKASNF